MKPRSDSKNLKDYWFIIPVYFTVCGIIFQFSYWSSFGLNAISNISFTDIIKSSISPFFQYNLRYILIIVCGFTLVSLFNEGYRDKRIPNIDEAKADKYLFYINVSFMIGSVITIALCYFFNKFHYIPIFMSFLLTYLFVPMKSVKKFFHEDFNYHVMMGILILFFYFPLSSFVTAKRIASNLIDNKSYNYVISQKPYGNFVKKYDRLKVIGNTEKHLILSDLKNTAIFMIKYDSMDSIVIYSQGKTRAF